MKWLYYPLAIVRILAFVALVSGLLVLVLSTAWISRHVRGAPIATWLCCVAARAALGLFGLEVRYTGRHQLRAHTGLVFVNHCSFVDILVLMSAAPLRFLSAAENRSWPIIGAIAAAIGTVFVDRSDRESRKAARDAIARAPKHPGIVVFPEGGISPAGELRPFRYGAFEICAETGTAFLPCTIQYEPQRVISWAVGGADARHEPLPAALWRIATYSGRKTAHLTGLDPVHPAPTDDARVLARDTHCRMAALLGWLPQM